MSIDIEVFDKTDRDDWDDIVAQSPQTTVFHQWAALEVQAAHSGTTLYPLVGYKGQEPVGLFPVFEMSKGPVTAVFSPPPYLWLPKLGPAFLNMAKLKQRKRERRRKRFIEGCFEWLDEELNPRYFRTRTNVNLTDPRPFKWCDCSVTPEFTYVTPLDDDPEALLDRFSSDARSNIRNGRERADEYTIREEGGDAAVELIDDVKRRFEAQGETFRSPSTFPKDLYERLPDGQIRPYVFRLDGEFVGGILAYDFSETVHRWHGGIKPGADIDLPVNDILDWRLMTDAIERGRTGYDLVGAGNPRINRYKAKFAPELRTFYGVERTSFAIDSLMKIYRRASKYA
jgi:hypothetical protein